MPPDQKAAQGEQQKPPGKAILQPRRQIPTRPSKQFAVMAWLDKTREWLGGFTKAIRVQKKHTFIDEHVFNSASETKTSDAFWVAPYKEAVVFEQHTVTSTPTDFYIEVWFSPDGGQYYKYMNNYFGDWRYEDTAGALQECVRLPILAPYMKIKIVSSGCDSSNKFTVSVKALFNS